LRRADAATDRSRPAPAGEPVEIEVKLSIGEPDAIARLLEDPPAERLAGFKPAGPVRVDIVLDRYLDSADGGLEAAGARIRLRESERGVIATLKRRGTVEAGITTRVEIDGEATADVDPNAWPDSPARSAVQAIVGTAPLVEVARLRQRRQVREVGRGGTRVELSLDRLEALDGERVVATRWELEAELKAGDRAALMELAEALGALPGVSAATQSKRSFALLASGR
jgi:inorganic triphosphatase YgiF